LNKLTAMARLGALALWVAVLSACAQPVPGLMRVPPPPPTASPTQEADGARETARALELARLQTSLETWKALRGALNAGYHYRVVFETHTGYRTTTTVVVRQHQVVERRLEAPGRQWVEARDSLGTHPEGAPPLSLDALYERAQQVLDVKLQPGQALSLGIDERGLLQHCYIQDRRVMDGQPMTGVPPLELKLRPF